MIVVNPTSLSGIVGKMVLEITNDYTMKSDETTAVYTGSGGHEITLATFSGFPNRDICIVNLGRGLITINCKNTEKIEGLSSIQLGSGDRIRIKSDGTNGIVV
jgi:hypothetical protein